ncbi:MAG TPA: tetrahydromethanopterin S-methyltransferase subunit C, partial [Methanocorpusculum sp.]|nr:tetrahydromethanopterin S-methyltransferase subunit C [Methanocorpusculum sp.]
MSVKVEASAGGVPHNTVMLIGAVIALVSLYIGIAGNYLLGVDFFAVFGGIAVIGALVWGNSTIKKLCSYGIGTGVPSAGMLAFGAGTAAFIAASAIVAKVCVWLVPVLIIVLALILGLIFGWIANSVENMKIPVMTRSIAELSVVGAIALGGFALLATGGIDFFAIASAGILGLNVAGSFIGAGIIAVGFMLGALALQHPFNAC